MCTLTLLVPCITQMYFILALVMWEIFSGSAAPYSDMSITEIASAAFIKS